MPTNSHARLNADKILIVRTDGIGDALVLAPLIAALRAAGKTLGIVLSTRNAEIFAPGAFAEVHVLERIPWPKHGSTGKSLARVTREVRDAGYDAALIASEEPEAYTLARRALVPVRIGFWNAWQKPLKSLWVRTQCTRVIRRGASLGDETQHEAEIVYQLGANCVNEPPPVDANRLRDVIVGDVPLVPGPAVMQLSPKWRAWGMPDDAFIALARGLVLRGVKLVGTAEDLLASAVPADLDVACFDSLVPWKAAIANASVVITPDSGAAHLAGMLGVPVIDWFPVDGYDALVRRWRPWIAPYRALHARADETVDALIGRITGALDALAPAT